MAIFDVIKYEGNNDVLVYRYPHTEFNTLSQLEVHESQEAIFFKDGKMLDSFGPGRYTLHTGNIPLLNKIINLPFGGESPFQCEVYFVNKALALNYKWGTISKSRVMDNQFHLYLDVGASGTLGLKVTNPRMLLEKVVGSETTLTAENCLNYFRENVSVNVKEYLARVMRKPEMSFLLLDMYLKDFSAAVKEMLQEEFRDVGVELYNFMIGTISIPDEQYNVIVQGQQDIQRAHYEKQLKKIEAEGNADAKRIESQGEAESEVILAKGRAQRRQIEGYNWVDEQVAEITKLYASNSNVQQNPANMIAQAPMALAFGNMLRGNMEPLMGMQFSTDPINFGRGKNTDISESLFFGMDVDDNGNIPDIGLADEDSIDERKKEIKLGDTENKRKGIKEKLTDLKEWYEEKLITEEEYKQEKRELLDELKLL